MFLRIRPCVRLNTVRFTTKQGTAKKGKSPVLEDIKVAKEATISQESSLLAQTDSSNPLKRLFNPFVLRTYGELQQEKAHPVLHYFRSTTDHILDDFMHKKRESKLGKGGTLYKYSVTSITVARRNVGSSLSETIQKIKSDKEQQYVASVLAITLPTQEKMWKDYDQGIVMLLNIDKMCSIDTGLLAFHALTSTGSELKMRASWGTPNALMNMIVRRRNQLLEKKIKANVFDLSAECNQLAPANNIEVFAQIGESKTRESKDLERLGLIIQLLSSPRFNVFNSPKERTDFNIVALEATEYGVKVFSALKHPAPISALKVVWTHAPKCNLPNSYIFYKSFFDQVLYSLAADPLQLLGEEEAVDSLLKSMVASKFKSSAVIAKLFEILSQRGFDYQKIGLKIFGSLVELNAMSFASLILNFWVESSQARLDSLADGSQNALWVGEKATQMVCDALASKRSFSYGDLTIMVVNCGRVEHKNMVHLKLLRDVEVAMTKEIANFSLDKVVALLRVYANTGRNYTPIIEQLCDRVNESVSTMNLQALGSVLWCAARLNLRSASYVDSALSRTINFVKEMSELNNAKAAEVTRLLWSMSVLRKLDLETFAGGKALLEQFVSSGRGGLNQELDVWTLAQLSQAWVEAKTLMREQGIDEKEWLLKNATTFTLSKSGQGSATDRKVLALPWYSGKVSISDLGDIKSSQSHLHLSKTFTSINVPHENEFLLGNGYVADVFIPTSALEEIPPNEEDVTLVEEPAYANRAEGESRNDRRVAEHDVNGNDDDYEVPFAECKGVVVEYDGPFHFESYRRAELGTTLMKRRHIKSAGYKMVNLPFWRYTMEGSPDTREAVVKTYLQKMGLRIKQK